METSNHTSVDTITDGLNRPIHDLRVSVTDRCNFRCVYCMPKEKFGKGYKFLAKTELLAFEEIIRVVQAFANLGVRKIRPVSYTHLTLPTIYSV